MYKGYSFFLSVSVVDTGEGAWSSMAASVSVTKCFSTVNEACMTAKKKKPFRLYKAAAVTNISLCDIEKSNSRFLHGPCRRLCDLQLFFLVSFP